MLTKITKILAISMLLALTTHTGLRLTLNQADITSVPSPVTAITPVTTAESFSQLTQIPTRSSSSSAFPSPQPLWQRLDNHTLPTPRIGSSFTLNPINKIALLFGGYNSSLGMLNDLWLTNGFDWMQFQTPHSPGERFGANMAYDEARQMAVLFGGSNYTQTLFGDTWLFNGVDWTQVQPLTSPSPRADAVMAYDADRNLTILFGGLADTGGKYWEPLNDMWIWDGENWEQQFPDLLPPARVGANMVYDRLRKSIVLFGGGAGGHLREDTWLWDGFSWTEQHPIHHPAGRADFGMAYDESHQQAILFGGQSSPYNDPPETWTWDGQDWTQLLTRQTPPEDLAYGVQLVYMPSLQTVMLYNDLREKTVIPDESFTITESSEVWALNYLNLIFLPFIKE